MVFIYLRKKIPYQYLFTRKYIPVYTIKYQYENQYESSMQKMDFDDLKPYLREYVEMITDHSRNQRDQYICPFCGSGTGPHGTGAFTVFPDHHFKCFSCGETGDIIDLIQAHEHLTKTEATRRALDLFSVPSGSDFRKGPDRIQVKTGPKRSQARKPIAPPVEWQRAIMPIVDRAAAVIFEEKGSAALEYLHSRGIDNRTIKEQHIGYIPPISDISNTWNIDHGFSYQITNPIPKEKRKNPDREKIFIPYGITFPYIMEGQLFRLEVRRLPDQVNDHVSKIAQVAEGQPAALFNADAAACKDIYRDIVFTEGVIDALSIIQTVGHACNDEISAVTFGSADYKGDYSPFFEYYVMPRRILIGFDNDKAGKENAEKLKSEIQKARSKIGVKAAGILFPKMPYKDWNEYLQKDPDTFFRYISDQFPI